METPEKRKCEYSFGMIKLIVFAIIGLLVALTISFLTGMYTVDWLAYWMLIFIGVAIGLVTTRSLVLMLIVIVFVFVLELLLRLTWLYNLYYGVFPFLYDIIFPFIVLIDAIILGGTLTFYVMLGGFISSFVVMLVRKQVCEMKP
jgi:hypothetical protein